MKRKIIWSKKKKNKFREVRENIICEEYHMNFEPKSG